LASQYWQYPYERVANLRKKSLHGFTGVILGAQMRQTEHRAVLGADDPVIINLLPKYEGIMMPM